MVAFGMDADAFEPSSSSTKAWNLNFSGCSLAKAIIGFNRSGGGSSPGVREQCIRVKRVFDSFEGLMTFVLNSCTKGVIPVPPEI